MSDESTGTSLLVWAATAVLALALVLGGAALLHWQFGLMAYEYWCALVAWGLTYARG